MKLSKHITASAVMPMLFICSTANAVIFDPATPYWAEGFAVTNQSEQTGDRDVAIGSTPTSISVNRTAGSAVASSSGTGELRALASTPALAAGDTSYQVSAVAGFIDEYTIFSSMAGPDEFLSLTVSYQVDGNIQQGTGWFDLDYGIESSFDVVQTDALRSNLFVDGILDPNTYQTGPACGVSHRDASQAYCSVSTTYAYAGSPGDVSELATLSFEVKNGSSFILSTFLYAKAYTRDYDADGGTTPTVVDLLNTAIFGGFAVSDEVTISSLNFGELDIQNGIANYATAVPIPAAAWLFSSAVLGLAGIRRNLDRQ